MSRPDLCADCGHDYNTGMHPTPRRPRIMRTEQTCYSYSERELALALGLDVSPQQWVVVEVNKDEQGQSRTMIDVLVRKTL